MFRGGQGAGAGGKKGIITNIKDEGGVEGETRRD